MLNLSQINKKGIFTRLVHSPSGLLMRIRFEVYEIDGVLKGHILSAEPIYQLSGETTSYSFSNNNSGSFCLPCSGVDFKYISSWSNTNIVSSYSSLYFLTNIKIRAPSQK